MEADRPSVGLLGARHFFNLTICKVVILPTWHFANLTVCQLDRLSTWQIVNLTVCQLDSLSTWQFVNLTVCQLDSLSTWLFTIMTFHQLGITSTWLFISLIFYQLEISFTTQKEKVLMLLTSNLKGTSLISLQWNSTCLWNTNRGLYRGHLWKGRQNTFWKRNCCEYEIVYCFNLSTVFKNAFLPIKTIYI